VKKIAPDELLFYFFYLGCIIGFVFCYVLVGPVLDVFSPINETRPKRMPHPAEYFIDQKKYYYVLLLNTYVGYVACVSIAVATDTMYVFLVEHICGMYGILWWGSLIFYKFSSLISSDWTATYHWKIKESISNFPCRELFWSVSFEG